MDRKERKGRMERQEGYRKERVKKEVDKKGGEK
jgi:hypothetical protein